METAKKPKHRSDELSIRRRFYMGNGEALIQQGENELHITGSGVQTYIWVGGKGCYGTLSGKKTLESLAFNILKALGRSPRAAMRKTKYNA